MELSEPVDLGKAMSEKPLCKLKEEPENRGWKCRIGKSGSPGDLETPTAARLLLSMKAAGAFVPEDPPKKGSNWDLDKCTKTAFPFQSHHLIPKLHLPTHDICVWLAKKAKNSEYELTESTNYDTDDAKNGMALPFASNTYQWKHAKSEEEEIRICNIMMFKTGLQLHQGQHTYEDYGEQDSLHENEQPGYLGAVDQLLDVIHGEALNHVKLCDDCKKSATSPIKVRPLEQVVAATYSASNFMRDIINQRKKFVSKKAANYSPPPPQ